MLAGQTLKG